MKYRSMRKLFQKDGTSGITCNRMTILKNKKRSEQIGRWKKQVMYFLRKLGSDYLENFKNNNYFECDVEED